MPDQPSLFEPQDAEPPTQHPDLLDADVTYFAHFFTNDDSNRLLSAVMKATPWRQETIKMYGTETPVPRLSTWHGDPGMSYTYSNIAMTPETWNEPLLEIKTAIEKETLTTFNSVLVNLYRDGADSVGWHSDDERELGAEPVIASVSFGALRKFQMRHKIDATNTYVLEPAHGSLLVMRGITQQCWKHRVPKTSRKVGQRVNLTFRTIT